MSDDKNPTQRPAVSLTEEQLKQAFDAGKQAAAEFKRMTLPPAKPGILDASKAYTDERVGVLKAEIDNLRDRVAMPERWIYEQEQRMEALAARVEELENRYSDLGRRHAKVVVRLEDIEEQIRGLASVQAGQGNNITAGSCSPDRDAVLPEPDDGREPAQSIAEPTPFDTQWDKHVDDLRQAQPPIAIEVGQVWRRKSGKTPPGSAVVEEVDSEGLVWMSGWGWFSPQGLVEDATLVEPAPKAEEPAEPVGWCPQCGPVTRVDEDGC
jgi:TolA-binding protein